MANTFFFDQESFEACVISAGISSYSIYNVLDFVMSFQLSFPLMFVIF
jgi:hypothetical protein